jgi:hypothetical protein
MNHEPQHDAVFEHNIAAAAAVNSPMKLKPDHVQLSN